MTSSELRLAAQHLVSELVELRRDQNLTQADLAARIGVSRYSVAIFESFRRSPGIETLLRYASAVGVELTVSTRRN